MEMVNNTHKVCIDECNKCIQACLKCFTLCLNAPDVAERKNCIITLLECAKICGMSSSLMSMNSEFAMEQCKICATVCDKCYEECSTFEDEHCQACAIECQTCANECRNMSNTK